jgi:phosphoribosylanthranilate isomerase
MVKIKICGITNLSDARAAVEAGADMLGFNFYRPSSRFIEPRNARGVIDTLRFGLAGLDRTVMMVGVFVNESSPEAVQEIADEAGVEAIQLHGNESPEFCARLKSLSKDRFVIKVLCGDNDDVVSKAVEYDVDAIMLDAFDKDLYGGTGRTIDWSIAARACRLVSRLFLAGGLSPENVVEAINSVQPYAVDACTALESLPGRKDTGRVRAFVRAARSG